MVRTCEVGLPLPLRTTFTYRIPDALDEATVTGARVLVPFRNRAMLGIVLGRGDSQDGAGLKEINEIVDPVPALSPQLVELGRWISSYYLSPVGETFRAMLPPSVEVRFTRQWQISEAGQARLQQLRELSTPTAAESADYAVLQLCATKGGVASDRLIRKLPGSSAAGARLLRKAELILREASQHRAARTQKTITWRDQAIPASSRPAEQRIQRALAENPGPSTLAYVLQKAGVSRGVIQRTGEGRQTGSGHGAFERRRWAT